MIVKSTMSFPFSLYINENNFLLNTNFFLLLKTFSTPERSWSGGVIVSQCVISTNDPVFKVCMCYA